MSPEQRLLMRFARGPFCCAGLWRGVGVCSVFSRSFTLLLGRELCSEGLGEKKMKVFLDE